MRFLAILMFLSLAAAASLSAQTPPEEKIAGDFDVISLDATIDLTAIFSGFMSGSCITTVDFFGEGETDEYVFHLRDLNVDSILVGDEKITAERVDTEDDDFYYSLKFPDRSPSREIEIFYSGEPTKETVPFGYAAFGGTLRFVDQVFGIGVGMHCNYVSTTRHWLPCYDLPSDKIKFSGTFVAPEGMKVASVGELVSEQTVADGVEFRWEHNYDCATYLLTFAVAEYEILDFTVDEDLPLLVYTQSAYKTASEYSYKKLPEMVECFETYFGEYPFEKVGYYNSHVGSMECQTMIAASVTACAATPYSKKDSMNSTVAHELSHQWFGNYATCSDFKDAWLNEGFATFCEALWREYIFGEEAYLDEIGINIEDYIFYTKYENVFPLYDFPRDPPSSNYPTTIYYKGSATVALLRYTLGDEVFFGALRNYLAEAQNRGGLVDSEFLKETLESESGLDLDSFFEERIYGKGWPIIEIESRKIPDGDVYKSETTIRQVQDPDSMGFYTWIPMEIGFENELGDAEFREIILTGEDTTIVFESLPDFGEINVNQGPSVRSLLELRETTILGVEEKAIAGEVKIYPNPAEDAVFAEFENRAFSGVAGQSTIINTSVHDLSGKEFITKAFILSPGTNTIEIGTENLPNGIYYLRLERGSQSISTTFVKE